MGYYTKPLSFRTGIIFSNYFILFYFIIYIDLIEYLIFNSLLFDKFEVKLLDEVLKKGILSLNKFFKLFLFLFLILIFIESEIMAKYNWLHKTNNIEIFLLNIIFESIITMDCFHFLEIHLIELLVLKSTLILLIGYYICVPFILGVLPVK